MIIRPIAVCDIKTVARIHMQSIRSPGSEIGMAYLMRLYRKAIDTNGHTYCAVAETGASIAGVILVTSSLSEMEPPLDIPLVATIIFRILSGSFSVSEAIEHFRFMKRVRYDISHPYLYIESIAVDQKYRRQGIGERLVRDILQHVPKGTTSLYVDTLVTNSGARAFYRKTGFHPIAEHNGSELLRYPINARRGK